MKYKTFCNSQYEVLQYNNSGFFIKDKKREKYYFTLNLDRLNCKDFTDVKEIKWNYVDSIYLMLIIASIGAFIYIFFQKYSLIYESITAEYIYIHGYMYMAINIAIHELSHYVAMRAYHRKPGKIRFRRHGIFITIVTDTTDSYMLPRYRRFIVYYAGIMINLLLYAATLLIFPNYAYLLRLVVWGIIYNMLPFGVLESDGYHILVNVFLGINETVSGKQKLVPLLLKIFFICFFAFAFSDSILRLLDMPNIGQVLKGALFKFIY